MVEKVRSNLIQELVEASGDWMEALRSRNEPGLQRILHDDFVLIASRGWDASIIDRKTWLQNAIDHWVLHDFRFEDVDIHVYGDAAVMRSRFIQRATVRGRPLNFTAYLTDVWIRDEGRWRVVTRHASPTRLNESTASTDDQTTGMSHR